MIIVLFVWLAFHFPVLALFLAPAAFFADIVVTLILYLAIMLLDDRNKEKKIHPDAMPLCKLILYIGLVQDFIFNVTWGTLFFIDPPRDFLFTGRLERYQEGPEGLRKKLANYFCRVLLDWAEKDGCHCNGNKA